MRWPAVLLLCAACGSSSSKDPVDEGVSFALDVSVPAAAEIHRCQFVRAPAEESFIVGGEHSYTPGSHHLVLFRTDLDAIPAELAGVRDCYEGAGGIMSHVRGVVYAAQTPTGSVAYPAGVGLPLAAGEVLLLQAHYVNATPAAREARVELLLRTAPAAAIAERAGTFFFYDPFIHVPAQGSATATMSCRVRNGVKLLSGASHMHRRGVGYRAFIDPPGGRGDAPFYTTDSWDHPGELGAPIDIAAGSILRFECDYANEEARPFFQGQSAEDDEMCMFSGVYYPAMELADDLCLGGPGRFGAGAASCAATLTCIQGCPPGTAPAPGSVLANIDVHECWQRCFADSCPAAWDPLMAMTGCTQSRCAAECAAGACAACAIEKCQAELTACTTGGC
jgi:hypothetical protein